jgi:hypothetical protein
MANKKSRKSKKVVDTKMAAANDTIMVALTPEQIIKEDERAAKAPVDPTKLKGVGLGIYYANLAGRPSKPAVISAFGKSGYVLSWAARAVKLNMTPEELCERFKADPTAVKAAWEKATIKS